LKGIARVRGDPGEIDGVLTVEDYLTRE